ncbi:helix-turn-helix domain-containing protein [Caryophanon tenue]|uniref:HTH cro/C1-type domain-containing protein n=1 Tax=Caryophanon tenue TaxID=33978 RepID=A0A1C0YDC4_9BACL|nr:helix-turn-helix transcriptional regulator [Caryophanon tenue]OCS85139.1 hypothetical protein A6M13_13915 [Caryophanon tenue]
MQPQTIGQRIRILRKERKMTLQQLAGERLTKGMLSLIENDKAQPSMESLRYIAQQLHVDISTLVEEAPTVDVVALLQQAEQLRDDYYESASFAEEYERRMKIITFLAPYTDTFTYKRFEEIRLLEMYASLVGVDEPEKAQPLLENIIDYYTQIGATSHVVEGYLAIGRLYFKEESYEESYRYLLEAHTLMQQNLHVIDTLTKLNVYFLLVIMASAIGDSTAMLRYMDEAMKLTKQEQVYYRMNDFYRVQYIHALQTDRPKTYYYLEKMEQFAMFTEDKMELLLCKYMHAHHLNFVEQRYEDTITFIQSLTEHQTYADEVLKGRFLAELGIAHYYVGCYEEALHMFEQTGTTKYMKHPLDLSFHYLANAFKGQTYAKLGDIEKAKKEILYAKDAVKAFPTNLYTDEIERIYEDVFSKRP